MLAPPSSSMRKNPLKKIARHKINIVSAIFKLNLVISIVFLLSDWCVAAFAQTADVMQGPAEALSLAGLSFSSINCNSLNLSSANKPTQLKKLYAIAKLRSDVIFLSDVRLSKKSTSGCISDLRNNFLTNPYESYTLFYNSTMNKRGTGILIKSSLGLSEIAKKCDPDENYIVLLAESPQGKRIILASIYGPNTHKPNFFTNLRNDVLSFGGLPIIIGGDWNCTISTEPAATNIDCFNMTNTPNDRHSALIYDFCETLEVSDPFRFLYPNKEEYSYVSKNTVRPTSRIDFFLNSTQLLPEVQTCSIDITRLSKAFDHNAIHIDFIVRNKQPNWHLRISPRILGNPEIDIVVLISVIETYLVNITEDARELLYAQADPGLSIGRARNLLCEAGTDPRYLPDELLTQDLINNRGEKLHKVTAILSEFNIAELQVSELNCMRTIFLETLLKNVRNDVMSYQSFIFKKERALEKHLTQKILQLISSIADNHLELADAET